jgi:hypothetical protein
MTKDQLVAELRRQGYGRIADLLDAEVVAHAPAYARYEQPAANDATANWGVAAAAAPKKKAR